MNISRRQARARRSLTFLLITALFLLPLCSGGARSALAATTRPVDPTYARIRAELESNNDAQIKSALAEIKTDAAKRGTKGFNGPRALNVLFDIQRYDDVDRIALATILAQPTDAAYDGRFEVARARALILLGKNEQALAAAKSYYNVVPMKQTQDAMNFVAQVLASARPDDADAGPRFLRQQVAWATTEPTTEPFSQPATDTSTQTGAQAEGDLGEPILPTIKVDPAPYAQAIDSIFPDTSAQALARGNLLLLADRTSEARACFELALTTARGSSVSWLIESVARSIRAQKGCVAPANAYIIGMQNNQN